MWNWGTDPCKQLPRLTVLDYLFYNYTDCDNYTWNQSLMTPFQIELLEVQLWLEFILVITISVTWNNIYLCFRFITVWAGGRSTRLQQSLVSHWNTPAFNSLNLQNTSSSCAQKTRRHYISGCYPYAWPRSVFILYK